MIVEFESYMSDLGFPLLSRDTMSMATLRKEIINLGWLTVSQVKSIIFMVGHDGIQTDMEQELSGIHLNPQALGSELHLP